MLIWESTLDEEEARKTAGYGKVLADKGRALNCMHYYHLTIIYRRCMLTFGRAQFYLPWKTTPEQKDIIDDQIQRAKATVEKEVEQFEARKQRHIERYGPPTRQISVTPDESAATRAPERESPIRSPHHSADKTHLQERRVSQDLHRGHHDESGDDLEEAEEDMVIY